MAGYTSAGDIAYEDADRAQREQEAALSRTLASLGGFGQGRLGTVRRRRSVRAALILCVAAQRAKKRCVKVALATQSHLRAGGSVRGHRTLEAPASATRAVGQLGACWRQLPYPGGKPLPALRSDAVFPLELHLLAAGGAQPPCLAPMRHQGRATVRTLRCRLLLFAGLLPPGRGRTLLGHPFQQPCAHPRQARVEFPLDLAQGGPWMLCPPVRHPPEHLPTQRRLVPLKRLPFVVPLHWPLPCCALLLGFPRGPILLLAPPRHNSLQNSDAHPSDRCALTHAIHLLPIGAVDLAGEVAGCHSAPLAKPEMKEGPVAGSGLEGMQIGTCLMLRRIGGGGMGDIYLAEQPELGRQVAVKLVRSDGALELSETAKAQATARFLQEARAIAALDHPHILPLFEYGEQDGLHYLVMPYVPDGSLIDVVGPASAQSALHLVLPLRPGLVAELVAQAAEALQFAHDRRVIHRDVKPQNLLVRRLAPARTATPAPALAPALPGSGQPDAGQIPPIQLAASSSLPQLHLLLADFGLARFMSALVGRTGTTGTPLYCAPEQYAGYPVPATDQYALACVAYLLLAGRPVFEGTVVELHHQHLAVAPEPASRANALLPLAADAVLLRALAKEPADRFPRIQDFAWALRAALVSQSAQGAQGLELRDEGTPWPYATPALAPDVTPGGTFAGMPYGPGVAPSLPPAGAFGMPASMTPASKSPYTVTPATTQAQASEPGQPGQPGGPGTLPAGTPPAGHLPADAGMLSQGGMLSPSPSPSERRVAPPPSVTPAGPWRAFPDAPPAPLPARVRRRQLLPERLRDLRNPRRVLLVALAVILVVSSLGALGAYLATHRSSRLSATPQQLAVQQVQPTHLGQVNVAQLPALTTDVPAAQAALVTVTDETNAAAQHIDALPSISETAPRLHGSTLANGHPIPALAQTRAGLGSAELGLSYPQDVSIGSSGLFVVEAVDGAFQFSRVIAGAVTTRIAFATFFAPILSPGDELGQPRVVYDGNSERWLVLVRETAQAEATGRSYFDVGMSVTSDPGATWYLYQFDASVGGANACTWADAAQIGANYSAFYVTATSFRCGLGTQPLGATLWALPKLAFLRGAGGPITVWTGFTTTSGQRALSLTPGLSTGPTPVEWLASDNAGFVDGNQVSDRIRLWAIADTPLLNEGATPPILLEEPLLPYAYADPPAAAQPNTAVTVSTGDARVTSVRFTGGHVYVAFTTAVNWSGDEATRSGVYWLDFSVGYIAPKAPSDVPGVTISQDQANIFGFPGAYVFYPSLMADAFGDVLLFAEMSSSSRNPSLIFVLRHKRESPNTLGQEGGATILRTSGGPVLAARWGDYIGTSIGTTSTGGDTGAFWVAGPFLPVQQAGWQSRLWEVSVESH
jgi:serine/threonine protein kinase